MCLDFIFVSECWKSILFRFFFSSDVRVSVFSTKGGPTFDSDSTSRQCLILISSLSGNIRPHSFQLAELLWTDPGIESRISVHELISASKKKKKAQAGIE